MNTHEIFPRGPALQQILNLQSAVELEDLLSRSLTDPLADLLSRPRKDLRGQLVEVGFRHGKNLRQSFQKCAPEAVSEVDLQHNLAVAQQILEVMHAGSLIIDDIEDGTSVRRGQQSLHMRYGLPIALNAGNWLYFLPFQLVEQMKLPESQRIRITAECQRTLLRAHYGQALDVGVPIHSIPQARIAQVTLASMELKSGVLTGFAVKLGAWAAGSAGALDNLEKWGQSLGLALQMFDDIGNLTSKTNPEKRGEDLKLFRPSFVFAVAAQELTAQEFQGFLSFLKNGELEKSLQFLSVSRISQRAREQALQHLEQVRNSVSTELLLGAQEQDIFNSIYEKLVTSYE